MLKSWATPSTSRQASHTSLSKRLPLSNGISEQGELDDLYYYQIRLGIEKRAQELDYDILRYFNDHPFTLSEEVIGILCIGKFSRAQISAFEEYQKPLVFLDSDTLSLGHTCIITDFYTAMKQVVDYFLSQGLDRIGILTGHEETTDQEEIIEDKRLENFRNYSQTKGIYHDELVFQGSFTAQSGRLIPASWRARRAPMAKLSLAAKNAGGSWSPKL